MKYLITLALLSACVSKPIVEQPPIVIQPVPKPSKTIEDYAKESYPVKGWDARYSEVVKLLLSKYPVKFPCDSELTLKAIINAESGFNNASVYHEPPPLGIDSIGLFQLSLNDAKYYPCLFKTEKQVQNPILNIDCAIKIMHKLQTKYPSLSFYEAQGKYWSVLRWSKYSVWRYKTQSGWLRVRKYVEAAGCKI